MSNVGKAVNKFSNVELCLSYELTTFEIYNINIKSYCRMFYKLKISEYKI